LGAECQLPSEAEWEYAARAGTTTEYALPSPEGSNDIGGKGLANCNDCGFGGEIPNKTEPVGSFPENAWKLCDMHGNVWEWLEDVFHKDYQEAPKNGSAWTSGGDPDRRVLRGGSWDVDQYNARSARRGSSEPNSPGARSGKFGFRVRCSSPGTDARMIVGSACGKAFNR